MSRRFSFPLLVALALALLFAGARAEAQGFGLSVTSSARSILVSNSLTYTVYVTNNIGNLTGVLVTNALSDSVQIVNATSSQGTITASNSVLVFNLQGFIGGTIARLTVNALPTKAGYITNTVTVVSIDVTNTVSTSVVVLVTNLPLTQVDLGVKICRRVQAVVTNDLTAYDVIVTNTGPGAAPGVALTNTLPSGVILRSASQGYTLSGSNLIFSLGTLASGSQMDVNISIQPTNVALLTLAASVGATGVADPNPTNNTASTNLAVISYLPGALLAVTNSAQAINPQNGLEEQSVLLTNASTNDVPSARLVVSGLTRQLFNGVGTNNGNPFVIYGTTLAAGGSVNLLLQFNPRGSFPFTNGQLQAFAVPVPNWTPPAAASTTTNLNLSRIVQLPGGNMLLEFPAVTNRTYTVVYSDNVLFSNALIAPPSIVAPASRVQWIDYGPPATLSAPTNASARFYRVFQNP